jgi:tRNA dimethylallyltransferase
MQPKQVVLFVGPTAAGKTAAAIETAKRIDGEIISADSMQIFKGMDIGTAKPKIAEMQGIPHHLIDELCPDAPYSVSLFQKKAFELIDEIISRGKVPIIAGGTGLYINAITYNLDFSQTSADEDYRRQLKQTADKKGLPYLYDMLEKKSPTDAARIHPNDEKRIIRRLEIIHRQGTCGEYNFLQEREGYVFKIIGLTMDRKLLYERINARVDAMMNEGLALEVMNLYQTYGDSLQSIQGIGYKELIVYLKGECTLDEAVENIKKATRNFAKRQMTWFMRDNRIKWLNTTYYSCLKELIDDIIVYIKNNPYEWGRLGN